MRRRLFLIRAKLAEWVGPRVEIGQPVSVVLTNRGKIAVRRDW